MGGSCAIQTRGPKKTMIHCYQLNGFNIVLDVHSGAVHVVDDASAIYSSSGKRERFPRRRRKHSFPACPAVLKTEVNGCL